jgi:hypothetical protein
MLAMFDFVCQFWASSPRPSLLLEVLAFTKHSVPKVEITWRFAPRCVCVWSKPQSGLASFNDIRRATWTVQRLAQIERTV